MKTKKAYISGPISGLENGNFDKFKFAQLKLEKEGYIVENPHEIGKEIYKKWSKIKIETQDQEKEMWNEFMKEDIKFLLLCDCVFVLDNWETSKGCVLELLIAQKLGIPIYYMKNYNELNLSFQITKFEKIPM
jgi:nucleoside 2-deoxyribosyltransferase